MTSQLSLPLPPAELRLTPLHVSPTVEQAREPTLYQLALQFPPVTQRGELQFN